MRPTFGCRAGENICIARDRDGVLVDVMLSEHRDLAAVKAFFHSARAVTGATPDRVTTGGHEAYPARSGRCWASRCGTGPVDISTIVSSRITAASRADVDPCSASCTQMQPDASAAPTTNSAPFSARDRTCANACPPRPTLSRHAPNRGRSRHARSGPRGNGPAAIAGAAPARKLTKPTCPLLSIVPSKGFLLSIGSSGNKLQTNTRVQTSGGINNG